MKTISFGEYAQSKQDIYLDVENVADCSTRIKNDNCEVIVHKSINPNDEPDYYFRGVDEDFAIIFGEDILFAYDCTWQDVVKYVSSLGEGEEQQKKYYTIKNENGRYLKTNGGWSSNIKGCVKGTKAQMEALMEQKKNSPYEMSLELLGESHSAWAAKMDRIKNN